MSNKINVGTKVDKGIVYNILDGYFNKEVSNKLLTRKYNISPAQICRITRGTRWTEVYQKFIKENNKDE